MILVIGACFVPRTFSHRSVGYWERLQLLDARSCDLRLQKKLLLLYNKTLGSRVEEPTNWIQMGDGCAKIGPIFSWYQREREHQIHQDQDGLLDIRIPVWAVLAVAHPMIFKQFWITKLGWREISQSIPWFQLFACSFAKLEPWPTFFWDPIL